MSTQPLNLSKSESIRKVEAFMMLGVVLAFGYDPSLMAPRILVMQSAGYVVVEASSLKETIDNFQYGDFDLVVLCDSVPSTDRERLTAWLRASGSKTPIVSIARSLGECNAFANTKLEDGPNKLVAGIQDVLIKAARTPAA